MCSEILDMDKFRHRRRLTYSEANPSFNLFLYLLFLCPPLSAALRTKLQRPADLNEDGESRGREDGERSIGRRLFKHGNGRLSITAILCGPAAADLRCPPPSENMKMN